MIVAAIEHLGLLDEDDLDLGRAALELAALDHPAVDLSPRLALLDEIAGELLRQTPADEEIAARAGRLSRLMVEGYGFTGDRTTYDDPANADLIEVLRRRSGLPVALALLYVAVARRAGWTAHVLDTPGHAMAALGRNPVALLDPFDDGAVFSGGDALRPAGPGAAAFAALAPMTNRAVLVRLLMNQADRAVRARDFARARTVMERITTAAPAYSPGWWERARLELAGRDVAAARLSLNSMLETTKDDALRREILEALQGLGAP